MWVIQPTRRFRGETDCMVRPMRPRKPYRMMTTAGNPLGPSTGVSTMHATITEIPIEMQVGGIEREGSRGAMSRFATSTFRLALTSLRCSRVCPTISANVRTGDT